MCRRIIRHRAERNKSTKLSAKISKTHSSKNCYVLNFRQGKGCVTTQLIQIFFRKVNADVLVKRGIIKQVGGQ